MQKVELEESRVGRTRASGTEQEERREEKLQREELEESKVGRTTTATSTFHRIIFQNFGHHSIKLVPSYYYIAIQSFYLIFKKQFYRLSGL